MIDVQTERIVCFMCGKQYYSRKNTFAPSHAYMYRGIETLPLCRNCVDALYNKYLTECGDAKSAVRQMCRKLDLYWHEPIYNAASKNKTQRTIMSKYLTALNSATYAGMCYDDTLKDEGDLWKFSTKRVREYRHSDEKANEPLPEIEIPDEVKIFWGPGYSNSMYEELESRRKYWMSKLPKDLDIDIGTEALIRQICALELDINRDRVAGKPIDKSINALNTLLGSANLKPAQKKDNESNTAETTPLGVWLYRYENERPLPDEYNPSPILKYVFTWMGHVCRMLGVKNSYEQMYQEEIDRLRVERPEYDGDDEELMMGYINGEFDEDEEVEPGEQE